MLCIGNVNVSFNWGTVNQRSDKRRIGRANYCGGEKFAAELACAPHPNPLPGGARGLIVLGVRWSASFSNARKPLCTVSDATRFSPSPLWGERRGEGGSAHETPHQPGNARKPLCTVSGAARFPPRPFGERGGVRRAARTRPHTSPEMQENHYARYQMQHVFPPRPFGERVGVRGQRACSLKLMSKSRSHNSCNFQTKKGNPPQRIALSHTNLMGHYH